jgi:hypothetical protein
MAESNEFFTSYPVLQVRPWGLLAYDRKEWHRTKRKEPKNTTQSSPNTNNNADGTLIKAYSGTMTPFAKKKLKRAIQLMVASAKDKEAINFKTGNTFKFKVNFITLTLPSPQNQITDKQLKSECLDNFIKRMRRVCKLNNYVWRAEKQKNGNLHFHMITDTYLHLEKIRNHWNAVLNKFGFIDRFEEKHGHRNPNSTDVHAVWKVKNLTQYFIKYMSKDNPGQDVIEGKLWDCSKALKTKKNCEVMLEAEHYDTWKTAYEDPELTIKSDDNFCIIFLNAIQFAKYVKGELLRLWEEYLETIRSSLVLKESPIPTG